MTHGGTTRVKCKRCGGAVKPEHEVKQYPWYCPTCDQNMFGFEVTPQCWPVGYVEIDEED